MSLPVSAYIITLNEGAVIENCVRSLDGFGEIVVVDSGSTDETLAILARLAAEGFPIRVMHRDWPGYAAQKQFALEATTLPWAFNIDADERLDATLRAALSALLDAPPEVKAWRVRRRNYLIGYGYQPRSAPEHHLLRLTRRGTARFDPNSLVHETILVEGEVRDAKSGSLLHYRPLPIADQIEKENRYSSLKAEQLARAGKGPRPWKLVFNPLVYFLRLYVRRRLYRCGWAGFIQAGTGAVYAFLTEAKLMQRALAERLPPGEENAPNA